MSDGKNPDKVLIYWGVGLTLAALLMATLVACSFGDHAFRGCMRSNFHFFIAWILQAGSAIAGGYGGYFVGKNSDRPWLGWVVGLALWIGLSFTFFWLGYELPSNVE